MHVLLGLPVISQKVMVATDFGTQGCFGSGHDQLEDEPAGGLDRDGAFLQLDPEPLACQTLLANYPYFSSILASLLLVSFGCESGPQHGNDIRTGRCSDGELLLTFCFHDVDGSTLARRIGDLADVEVLTDPVNERVSVCVEQIPWQSALRLVAQEMFCAILELRPGLFRVVEPACKMPLAFDNADVMTALELFAARLGRKVRFASSARGSVTGVYSLGSREDVRRTFEAISAAHGLRVKWPDPCLDSPIVISVK